MKSFVLLRIYCDFGLHGLFLSFGHQHKSFFNFMLKLGLPNILLHGVIMCFLPFLKLIQYITLEVKNVNLVVIQSNILIFNDLLILGVMGRIEFREIR